MLPKCRGTIPASWMESGDKQQISLPLCMQPVCQGVKRGTARLHRTHQAGVPHPPRPGRAGPRGSARAGPRSRGAHPDPRPGRGPKRCGARRHRGPATGSVIKLPWLPGPCPSRTHRPWHPQPRPARGLRPSAFLTGRAGGGAAGPGPPSGDAGRRRAGPRGAGAVPGRYRGEPGRYRGGGSRGEPGEAGGSRAAPPEPS